MKFVRCLSAVLFTLLLTGCATHPPIDVGPAIEKPITLDEAMLTLTVSDFQGFLDETGTVVSQIAPMMGGSMLKTVLGSKLGDPALAGFAPSNGLAVVMLNPTNLFAVAEVESAQAASYIQSLQSFGLIAKQQSGLLLIAKNEAQLAAAEPLVGKVQADLLDARRDASLRFSLKPAALIDGNEKKITAGLQQMLETMEQAAGSNTVMDVQLILEAEMQVFLSLGRQVESVEITLSPVNGAIHLSKVVQPVAGSRLAAYCNAPAARDWNPKLQSGMLPSGVIELEYCMRNPDALLAFINGEIANLFTVMDLDPAITTQWSEYMTRWMGAMDSTICESIFTAGDKPFGFAVVADVKNEEAIVEAFRSLTSDLEAAGFFKLYKSIGMPIFIDFEESVREVSGITIHQLKMDFDLENVSAEERKAMAAMIGDMNLDVAIVNDILIYTAGEGAVEKMIEQLMSGELPVSQLAARSAFPSGGTYYADFDLGGYVEFVSAFAGEEPEALALFEKFAAVMQDAEPMVMSSYCNSGRMKFCSQIPADLLVRFAQLGQLLVMENMQKKAAAAQEEQKSPAAETAPVE